LLRGKEASGPGGDQGVHQTPPIQPPKANRVTPKVVENSWFRSAEASLTIARISLANNRSNWPKTRPPLTITYDYDSERIPDSHLPLRSILAPGDRRGEGHHQGDGKRGVGSGQRGTSGGGPGIWTAIRLRTDTMHGVAGTEEQGYRSTFSAFRHFDGEDGCGAAPSNASIRRKAPWPSAAKRASPARLRAFCSRDDEANRLRSR